MYSLGLPSNTAQRVNCRVYIGVVCVIVYIFSIWCIIVSIIVIYCDIPVLKWPLRAASTPQRTAVWKRLEDSPVRVGSYLLTLIAPLQGRV
jgi:hypothetical protein